MLDQEELEELDRLAALANLPEKVQVEYAELGRIDNRSLSAFLVHGNKDDGDYVCVDEDARADDDIPSPRMEFIAELLNAWPKLNAQLKAQADRIEALEEITLKDGWMQYPREFLETAGDLAKEIRYHAARQHSESEMKDTAWGRQIDLAITLMAHLPEGKFTRSEVAAMLDNGCQTDLSKTPAELIQKGGGDG